MFAPVDRARVAHVVSAAAVALVLAGGFHLFRGAPVDGIVCLTVAVAILVDAARPHRSTGAFPARMRTGPMIWIGGAGLGLGLGLLPATSWLEDVLLAGIGVFMLVVGWPGPDERGGWRWRAVPGTSRARTARAWSVLVVAACLLELVVFFLGDHRGQEARFPAVSDLLGPVFAHPVGRVVFAWVWLALGWFLLRLRPRHGPGDRSR